MYFPTSFVIIAIEVIHAIPIPMPSRTTAPYMLSRVKAKTDWLSSVDSLNHTQTLYYYKVIHIQNVEVFSIPFSAELILAILASALAWVDSTSEVQYILI